MKLPQITHLQFSVLAFLQGGERPGKSVRQQLAERGMRRSGPAFYQLMSRLEDAGLVESGASTPRERPSRSRRKGC